jgi:hypothetical protein
MGWEGLCLGYQEEDDMTTNEQAQAAVAAYKAAHDFAEQSFKPGKPFLAAFGVADALGFEKESLEWKLAVSGAYAFFKTQQILVNKDGILV